ncbi:PTS glucitol/sorbitol transporter subunit IIA [Thermoanaerobacterium sp. CMT5567-10]|uniref:PTS glucitol/sorbitol transporter subunit IIA n=1 Tax=Thermoanaerobacterium sp. CMT5567-10 TaxID=3061989 RepID=UPI0026DFD3D7|nr:PTS glucitol/sorbitol transporter subunit IIA [Thermoanaerobacterium sp. CMT5567-10]WKV10222.1 PTS glucitol/sorbitol transporter subunit IIA [Thermoanaerobacterium sp. CMT5567-10]
MNKIYETKVTKIGVNVLDFYNEKILILFKDNAPAELIDYCILHSLNKLYGEIKEGDILRINEKEFKITAVGDLVNKNLKALGHICLKFDGSTEAELPGSLYVEDKEIPKINIGDIIIIRKIV